MAKVYTWTARPATRSVTVAGMRAEKGSRKWTQVTANSEAEAAAAAEAGLDLIICNCANVDAVRRGDDTLFLTAAIPFPDFATVDDVVREAFRCLGRGADAVMTARSMKVVETLAREDVPVMGHLGLVPRKSTWTGGLRAVGRKADEALELYRRFKALESAGAAMVEAEVIPGRVMEEISKRTQLITVSLGSGGGADVHYLFMEDICGDTPNSPRHARKYADLSKLRAKIDRERVKALKAFQKDAMSGGFPGDAETVGVSDRELGKFRRLLEKERG